MFGNIKDMMKQVQQAQASIEEAKKELAKLKVIGESGAGLVKVVMTGLGDIIDLEVDDSLFTEDKHVLLDLIKAACNNANAKREKVKTEKMGGMLSKMGLPKDFNFSGS